jgi:hypothetical protein
VGVHLGDPAEIAGLRGRKKRAKTDRADARLLRTLLVQGYDVDPHGRDRGDPRGSRRPSMPAGLARPELRKARNGTFCDARPEDVLGMGLLPGAADTRSTNRRRRGRLLSRRQPSIVDV